MGLDFLSGLAGAAKGSEEERVRNKEQEDLLARLSHEAKLTDRNKRREFNRERKLQEEDRQKDSFREAAVAMEGLDKEDRFKHGIKDIYEKMRPDEVAKVKAAFAVKDAGVRQGFLDDITKSAGILGRADEIGKATDRVVEHEVEEGLMGPTIDRQRTSKELREQARGLSGDVSIQKEATRARGEELEVDKGIRADERLGLLRSEEETRKKEVEIQQQTAVQRRLQDQGQVVMEARRERDEKRGRLPEPGDESKWIGRTGTSHPDGQMGALRQLKAMKADAQVAEANLARQTQRQQNQALISGVRGLDPSISDIAYDLPTKLFRAVPGLVANPDPQRLEAAFSMITDPAILETFKQAVQDGIANTSPQ